jgi:hypothetical protein
VTDPFRELDAAYVLGALSSDDRREFEAHLRTCDECSKAVRELAGLPGLLAVVPTHVVEMEPAGPVPDTLLPSLVRQVRRESRRRRWQLGAAAAAAAVAVGVGGTTLAGLPGQGTATRVTSTPTATKPSTSTAAAHSMTAVRPSPLQAQVSLNQVAWGTRLDLTCTYTTPERHPGLDEPAYVLVVRSGDGKVEQVATWRVVPGRTMRLSGATALTTADIVAVEVRTQSGTPLLTLRT